MIKLKPDVLELLEPLLISGEEIQLAIACGNLSYTPARKIHTRDRDYLLITSLRLISIKGKWFATGQDATSYPRDTIFSVDVATFLLGCNVTVNIHDSTGNTIQLIFPNCGKPEGEAVKKIFAEQEDGRRCPACGRLLRADFAFCPFCKANLKRLCHSCNKPLEAGWVSCPFCGL